jgi:hypothetical protein
MVRDHASTADPTRRMRGAFQPMKFQVTFPKAVPIHERVAEHLAQKIHLLGREDLTLIWSDRGELLTVVNHSGNELAKAPCPPLSDSSVPIEIKTASIFAWLQSVLEMVRK